MDIELNDKCPPTYDESQKTSSLSISNPLAATGSAPAQVVLTVKHCASVEQVNGELTALAQAQLNLYRRIKQVKVQIYAALVLMFFLVGIIMIYLFNHPTPNGTNLNKPMESLIMEKKMPQQEMQPRVMHLSSMNSLEVDTIDKEQFFDDTTESIEMETVTDATITPTSTSTTTTTTMAPAPPESYNISIVVVSAHVPDMDYIFTKESSDTYCVIYVDNRIIAKTQTISNHNWPQWRFATNVIRDVKPNAIIKLYLYDQDLHRDDFIDYAAVRLDTLIKQNRINKQITETIKSGYIDFIINIVKD